MLERECQGKDPTGQQTTEKFLGNGNVLLAPFVSNDIVSGPGVTLAQRWEKMVTLRSPQHQRSGAEEAAGLPLLESFCGFGQHQKIPFRKQSAIKCKASGRDLELFGM